MYEKLTSNQVSFAQTKVSIAQLAYMNVLATKRSMIQVSLTFIMLNINQLLYK